MVLEYRIKSVYGEDKAYLVPFTREADAIAMLTRRKTLTATDRKALEALGFTFTQVV